MKVVSSQVLEDNFFATGNAKGTRETDRACVPAIHTNGAAAEATILPLPPELIHNPAGLPRISYRRIKTRHMLLAPKKTNRADDQKPSLTP